MLIILVIISYIEVLVGLRALGPISYNYTWTQQTFNLKKSLHQYFFSTWWVLNSSWMWLAAISLLANSIVPVVSLSNRWQRCSSGPALIPSIILAKTGSTSEILFLTPGPPAGGSVSNDSVQELKAIITDKLHFKMQSMQSRSLVLFRWVNIPCTGMP